jgi:hypothetical protein
MAEFDFSATFFNREYMRCRHNYLLGDLILFQTVRLRHNLSDRREERGRTLCSVIGAAVPLHLYLASDFDHLEQHICDFKT